MKPKRKMHPITKERMKQRRHITKTLENAGLDFVDVVKDHDGNFRLEFDSRYSRARAGYGGDGDPFDALAKVAEQLADDAGYEGPLGPIFDGYDGYYLVPVS